MAQTDHESFDATVPQTARVHQQIARVANEAARLKAAHRYFQRTATRRPFRREEIVDA